MCETGRHLRYSRWPKVYPRVWHLDCPTITLVARTITRQRGLKQFSYFPEGIAVRYRRKAPIEFQRRREFLSYLFRRRHPRRITLAKEMLSRTRGYALYTLLGDLLFYLKQPDHRDGTRKFDRGAASEMSSMVTYGASGYAQH